MSSFTLLRVDASMTRRASTSRMLTDRLISRLDTRGQARIITRDLAEGVPFISEDWIRANFTDPSERSAGQQQALAVSDMLVQEMREADVLVMSVPIYNFGVPAAFKAWIDQVARARETFRYTSQGPQGLLTVKASYLIVSSGGTPVGSDSDYVTGYIHYLFGFLGIRDIHVIPCDGVMAEGESSVQKALDHIDSLPPYVPGS